MDKLSSYKVSNIMEVIEAASTTLLYFPPYLPDYSPIANCWSKLRTSLRKAKARTREALDDALKRAIESITDTYLVTIQQSGNATAVSDQPAAGIDPAKSMVSVCIKSADRFCKVPR